MHSLLLLCVLCLQDAVIRGWFRTTPHPLKGAPHLRVIGLTALEIAVAMQHLHEQGVLHGVSVVGACCLLFAFCSVLADALSNQGMIGDVLACTVCICVAQQADCEPIPLLHVK